MDMTGTPRTPAAIEVHIEELVLHGFAPGDRYRIGDAVQSELERLLAEQGLPPEWANGGEIASVDGGSFTVANGQSARIGTQIGQTVHRTLKP